MGVLWGEKNVLKLNVETGAQFHGFTKTTVKQVTIRYSCVLTSLI